MCLSRPLLCCADGAGNGSPAPRLELLQAQEVPAVLGPLLQVTGERSGRPGNEETRPGGGFGRDGRVCGRGRSLCRSGSPNLMPRDSCLSAQGFSVSAGMHTNDGKASSLWLDGILEFKKG